MTDVHSRIAQVSHLVAHFNKQTNIRAYMCMDGKNDLFIVKLQKEENVLYNYKLESFSKKQIV